MADVRAVKSGNWSDTTVWNTGALPTSADDVWANTFTVAADTTTTVLSIRNGSTTGVTAGGGFTAVNGVTLTLTGAGVVATGTVTCFTSNLTTGQSCTITGNVAAGTTGNGAVNSSSGTLIITGSCTGASGSGSGVGALNSAGGTLTITGNCSGGSSNNAAAAGASNASLGTLNVTGTCTGGSATGPGASNTSTGSLVHIGTAQATTTAPALTGTNLNQATTLTGPFLTSTNGVNPVMCARWFWQNTTPPATYYQIRSANLSVIRPLYTADSVGGNPATSDVRSGTVYGPNSELTGTCAVPAAASVAFGVPVDNTTGTAALTTADIQAALTAQGLTTARAAYLDRLPNTSTTQEVADIIDAAI